MIQNILSRKTALIAGSTQGIGLAIAQKLAAQGANCTLIARNEERLKKTIAELPGNPANHSFLTVDFNDYRHVEAVVEAYVKQYPVSILINNTGGPSGGPITSAQPDEFITAFKMHVICNQILAGLVVPGMKATGFGRIINIISTSVKIPIPNLGVSNTVRGAVASWAKTLSNELAPFGITVNNILPGYTQTARLESIVQNRMKKEGKNREEVESTILEAVPMKRFGQPEEIAAVAAFLASPEASYVTGVSIPVDGGRTGCI